MLLSTCKCTQPNNGLGGTGRSECPSGLGCGRVGRAHRTHHPGKLLMAANACWWSGALHGLWLVRNPVGGYAQHGL